MQIICTQTASVTLSFHNAPPSPSPNVPHNTHTHLYRCIIWLSIHIHILLPGVICDFFLIGYPSTWWITPQYYEKTSNFDLEVGPIEIGGVHNDEQTTDGSRPAIGVTRFSHYMAKHNAFARILSGENIDSEQLDSAVNAMALICALTLTIPYSLMSSLDQGFWDWIYEVSVDCPLYDYHTAHNQIVGNIRAAIFFPTYGLIFSTFYYLLKPKDIRKWWPRGRIFFVLLCCFTATTVTALLLLSNTFIAWYMVSSYDFCTQSTWSGQVVTTTGLVGIFALCLILFL